jgi:hypothetical protein
MDSDNTSDNPGITCIVTIHGIGFQQPPSEDVAGYADDLHAHLHEHLGDLLSDDPNRQSYQHGMSVPIYVQSSYRLPSSEIRSREEGMKRLGTWRDGNLSEIGTTDAHLTLEGASIAHVALVYSKLEGNEVRVVPSVITLLMALSSLLRGNYDSIFHLCKMLWADVHPSKKPSGKQKVQKNQRGATPGQSDHQEKKLPVADHDTVQGTKPHVPSLSVRQDGKVQTVLSRRRRSLFRRRQPASPDDLKTVFLQLQNDVALYICSNEMREQIRSFVLDALWRLASRKDVSSIVINAHSNGTVIAFDALCSLPPAAASKIKALVTAGSPLRKYTTLFTWGQHIDTVPPIQLWKNFWDEQDPVADRLEPCFEWRRSKDPTPDQLTSLYWARHPETGEKKPLPIEDIRVDNVTCIPHVEGLVAHNYWDNTQEFIPQVAKIVRNVVYSNVQAQIAYPSLYPPHFRKKMDLRNVFWD